MKMLLLAGGSASGSRRARGEAGVALPGRGPSGIRCDRVRRTAAALVVGLALAAAFGSVASAADAQIYWASASGNTIAEADLDGTHVNESFITGADAPSDVVVYGQHIYWGNATSRCAELGACPGTIGEANLNGTEVNENFIPATTPYGLTVAGQYIYWSNFGSGTIGRATLGGTEVNQSFITGAKGPDGLAVNGQNIYWANSGSNTIGDANLDGTAVNQSFITGADVPEGMTIDSQYIYWANHEEGTIGRASLDGAGVSQSFITGAGSFPTRVAVDGQYIYWTTWTADMVPSTGSIGRANINGTEVNNSFIYSANSPVGVAVTAEAVSGGGSVSGAGAAKCLVPNVKRKKLAVAKKAIVKAHCVVGRVKGARSKHVKKGSVVSQGPAAGKSLPVGSKVNLVVSKG